MSNQEDTESEGRNDGGCEGSVGEGSERDMEGEV